MVGFFLRRRPVSILIHADRRPVHFQFSFLNLEGAMATQSVGSFIGRVGPAGTHRVVLAAIDDVTNDIGLAYRWTFRVVGGDHAGCIFVTTTGRALLGGTAVGDLLDMLYGRRLCEGDTVDFAELIGREYDLIARPGKASGGVFHSITLVVEKEAK
ncbi:MAG: hypothetical protein ACYC6N_18510 [Pirellulaceae bacterium]